MVCIDGSFNIIGENLQEYYIVDQVYLVIVQKYVGKEGEQILFCYGFFRDVVIGIDKLFEVWFREGGLVQKYQYIKCNEGIIQDGEVIVFYLIVVDRKNYFNLFFGIQ